MATDDGPSTTQSKSTKYADANRWFYPKEMAEDLRGVDIPAEMIQELLGLGWEFARISVPHFTNYPRYIAYCRLLVLTLVAEFKGKLCDVKPGDRVCGYDVEALLNLLFDGTVYKKDSCREFRCYMVFTGMKTSRARNSNLFKQYADCLAHSPKAWFRLRDCDALMRFAVSSGLACNDFNQTWFAENELQLLAEVCMTMYDSAAFYKHRAEGEIHCTFAYLGESMRKECHRCSREILWALDAAWANIPSHRLVLNLIRNFAGPMHIMVRRYRYIEDGLTVGLPETDEVIEKARQHEKLWYRIENRRNWSQLSVDKTMQELEKQESLFPGFIKIFQDSQMNRCKSCLFPESYGANHIGEFSCVRLCDKCRLHWQEYVNSLPTRLKEVFPFL